jgi:hypothetical protein
MPPESVSCRCGVAPCGQACGKTITPCVQKHSSRAAPPANEAFTYSAELCAQNEMVEFCVVSSAVTKLMVCTMEVSSNGRLNTVEYLPIDGTESHIWQTQLIY